MGLRGIHLNLNMITMVLVLVLMIISVEYQLHLQAYRIVIVRLYRMTLRNRCIHSMQSVERILLSKFIDDIGIENRNQVQGSTTHNYLNQN